MPVQMELKRIIISEVHEQQIIVLREVDGERSFPIVIGIFEATSIDRRVKNIVPPRPLTHDLIVSVIDQLGGDLQDIVISDLQDHTYFAKLRVRREGELIEIDCRPSDAIAVAVTAKVPIWVAEDVLATSPAALRPAARHSHGRVRMTVPRPWPTADSAVPKNCLQLPKMNFFSVQKFPHPIGFGHPSGAQLCSSHQSCHWSFWP